MDDEGVEVPPCPICGGNPTKLYKHTFVSLCGNIQVMLDSEKTSAKKKKIEVVCDQCVIREDIKKGDDFDPPPDVEFLVQK